MTTTRDLIQRLADLADALDGRKPLVFAQGQSMDGFTALANFQSLANEARTYLSQPEPEGLTEVEILNLGNDVMGNCLPCDPDLLLAFARAVLSADRILAQAAARKLRQSLQE